MMHKIFADTSYWVALISPKDKHHEAAKSAQHTANNAILVTSESVMLEVGACFSKSGPEVRNKVTEVLEKILSDPNVEVVAQKRSDLNSAIKLYKRRLDKTYSLVDCMSMILMRRLKIDEVLTTDHHFEQEKYSILMETSE